MSKSKKIQIRPILLGGHDGPIQKVRYNRDGDLIFTCAKKDNKACVWFAHTGERLGSYNGHEGMIYDLDTDFVSKRLLTGSADRTVKIWDLEEGSCLKTFEHMTTIRAVGYAEGEKMFLTLQDESRTSRLNEPSTVFVYNLADDLSTTDTVPIRKLSQKDGAKMTHAMWAPLNEHILTCDSVGYVRKWNVETGHLVESEKEHRGQISSMQFSWDKTMFITASKDQTAKLWDTKTMKVKKIYSSDRPINGAAISPLMNHVIIGGGQDARDVTTTGTRSGKFEAEFYHMVYQDYMGTIKGHFGPINFIAFSPDGKSYSSGGEDGYIRIHHFDHNYFKTKPW